MLLKCIQESKNTGFSDNITTFTVSRYSNGHKYPKQKQRTPNLTSFALISLAIMFTTNSCVKHRILHVLQDAVAISHVKTGEINADVLIADVIRKCNLKKNNPQYLVILYIYYSYYFLKNPKIHTFVAQLSLQAFQCFR